MNKRDETISWLTQAAREFLKTNFNCDLSIPIIINKRMKRTLGAYKIDPYGQPKQIDLSYNLIQSRENEIILDILYHELIHHGLHLQNKPFKDNSPVFKDTCHQLNVSLSRTYSGLNQHRYQCRCRVFVVDRKLRLSKGYRCKYCHSKIEYLQPQKSQINKNKNVS